MTDSDRIAALERQMRTAQRRERALRKQVQEDAQRTARLEVELSLLHEQVVALEALAVADGHDLTPAGRPRRIITAEQRRAADALCETYAAELWTKAERETFRSLKADEGGAR